MSIPANMAHRTILWPIELAQAVRKALGLPPIPCEVIYWVHEPKAVQQIVHWTRGVLS